MYLLFLGYIRILDIVLFSNDLSLWPFRRGPIHDYLLKNDVLIKTFFSFNDMCTTDQELKLFKYIGN